MKYKRLDFNRIKTYPITERLNKTNVEDLGNTEAKMFIDSVPNIFAGKDFKDAVKAIANAHRNGKNVILALSALPIKWGVGPFIIKLMKRGIVTGIAMNGAAPIHDFELAMIGKTSEDVPGGLEIGKFGMVEETGRWMNAAIKRGAEKDMGMGEALGRSLIEMKAPFIEHSVLATAVKLDMPITVHTSFGTDIIHMHPTVDGGAIGKTSMNDFKLICSVVGDLEGGVWINMGSETLLPEVFLKALTIARNVGNKVDVFTTMNIDKRTSYRQLENVLRRPPSKGGRGINLTCDIEVMVPLLTKCVLQELESNENK